MFVDEHAHQSEAGAHESEAIVASSNANVDKSEASAHESEAIVTSSNANVDKSKAGAHESEVIVESSNASVDKSKANAHESEAIAWLPNVRFRVIKGTFHVVKYEPDGDSIRFKASKRGAWRGFAWRDARKGIVQHKQLRLEGIDALETHYLEVHQPFAMGLGALNRLFELIGITDVQYGMSRKRIIAAHDGIEGFIATHEADEYDRPVSLLFPETSALHDGARLHVKDMPLDECINLRMLREGLVYPTFYTTTDREIVRVFSEATRQARETGKGLWAIDRTRDFTVFALRNVYEDYFILPKLFRRIAAFTSEHSRWEDFTAFLQRKGDRVRLKTGEERDLASLVRHEGRRFRVEAEVEEIIFVPNG